MSLGIQIQFGTRNVHLGNFINININKLNINIQNKKGKTKSCDGICKE